jgi:uncharacterized repeat protein (TIGR03803 family)
MKRNGFVLTLVASALLGIGAHTAAAQESVVYSFDYGQIVDGNEPNASLISDALGNLYGTTVYGGAYANGAVFELSPAKGGGWTEQILYSFYGGTGGALDPQNPLGSLIFDKSGNLYGTTVGGGTNNGGTVFELSPGTGGVWTEKTLHSFAYGNQTAQTDSSQPQANLIFDAQGNLYGTSLTGGIDDNGTVFELSPGTDGAWTEKVLYNFTGNDIAGDFDGFNPRGGLIFDAEGNLYGTTSEGGENGFGTAFELSPGKGGAWTEKQLCTFTGQPGIGAAPAAGLIFDSEGNLYGTTHQGGGPTNEGTVFELSPNGGAWTYKLLWSFAGGPSDGAQPYDTLIFDAQGNLYGTTLFGGPNGDSALGGYFAGTVFELSPTNSGPWTETVLHNFYASTTDGYQPYDGLIADTAGNLYGTTYQGGAHVAYYNPGTVFEIAAAGLDFSLPAGVYTGTQSVTLTSGTKDATIYYTTNGSTPTTSSTKYTDPIEVEKSLTIKAFSLAAGYPNSAVVSNPYTIRVETPKFSPAAGTYTSTQSVTISDGTTGATIYYTTGGSTPSTSSTKYSGAISVAATETLKAIAAAAGDANSVVSTAAYIITPPAATPVITPAAGTYTTPKTITIADASSGVSIYYATDGSTPTSSSTKYTAPFKIAVSATVKAVASGGNYSESAVASSTYTIKTPAATPLISPASGVYFTPKTIAITDATAGAVIYYTTDSAKPTTTSTKYTGAFKIPASATVEAIAIAPTHSQSGTAKAVYTIETPTARPVISPVAGTYATPKTITIADADSGAEIYYTTNGSTPTTTSTKYAAPFKLPASATVKAIAIAAGHSSSSVASAAYTIETPAAKPVFSPAAGTYKAAQTVTLADTTKGAVIYFTTNGTTPTTSSTKYTAAIAVKATETLKAIAVAPGFDASAEASATYTIQ